MLSRFNKTIRIAGGFLAAALLAIHTQQALAFQIPTTASGTWTNVGGVAQKTTPSGVRVNVALVNTHASNPLSLNTLNNTALMTGLTSTGATAGAFLSPQLPTGTNGLAILATTATACQATNPTTADCNTFGTINVTFTDSAGNPVPVRNPVMHLARVAGSITTGLVFGVRHTLTTPGVTLGALPANAKALNITGQTINPSVTNSTTTACENVTNNSAGCGSVPIIGTTSSLSFDIGARRQNTALAWNGTATAGDAWYVTFSFDEDFGDAPSTYQGNTGAANTAPASHILSDLALGSAFNTNNNYPTTINGTVAGASPFWQALCKWLQVLTIWVPMVMALKKTV